MVSRQDIRNINAAMNSAGDQPSLIEALDELEELYSLEQRDGVTVDDEEFAEAQEDAKAALVTIWEAADDAVDRTGVLEVNGEERDLPNPAVDRAEDAVGKPENPGGD